MNAADAQTLVDEKTTALLDRIVEDNSRHGGLLSRETARAADELRIAVAARNVAKAATPEAIA